MDTQAADAVIGPQFPVGIDQGSGMPIFMAAARSVFRYVIGKATGGPGIGAENMALVQSQTLPIDSMYSSSRNVLKSFGPIAGGTVKPGQDLVSADLLGNGVYYSGTLGLGALSVDGNISPGNG